MKKAVLINLLFCFCIFAGQYKTIETNQIRVVFEDGLEEEAKTVASNIEKLKPYYEDGNKKLLKKIPVILKKDNAQSNAYFHPTLQKMEFITTPMLDDSVGTTPWLTALSIHEYRHYTQYRMATKDNFFSKYMYLIGGEFSRTLLELIEIPQWFDEGDAVYYETKLSNNGRGRTPNFLKEYRALLDENKQFTYEKAKNGSYKDYVPNHYYLGYVLVSYGYEKYGDKFWEEILALTGTPKKFKGYKNPYTPLSNALQAKTGLNSKEFYKEALKYYEEKFKAEKKIDYATVNKKAEVPTNYTSPHGTKDGILILKKSFNEWASLYKLKNGEEEKVIDFGNIAYNYYSIRDNKIIWSEIEPNLTNSKKNYSNIKIYDLETKKKINLTEKSFYFFPRLSRDKNLIATVYSNGTETTKIHILDNNGQFVKELPNNKAYQYSSIDWSKDNKSLIVSLRDKEGKMELLSIDLENYNEKEFIPFNDYIIGTVNVIDDNVIFTGSFDYVENEYRFNIKDGKVYKLTSSNIGTSGGTVIDGELYFSEYSANGYNLKKSEDIVGEEVTPKSLLESEKLNTNNFKETDLNLIDSKEEKEYSVKNYSYMKHLIKPYGWIFSNKGAESNITVMTSNELEDFDLTVNYKSNYETNAGTFNLYGELTRYWPNINLQYEKGDGTADNIENIGAGLSFPMNLSKNEFFRASNLTLNYFNYFNEKETQYALGYGIINSKYPAIKDLVTDGSQKVNILYRTDLEENSKLNLNLALTTKGFFENDGFKYEVTLENDRGNLKHIEDKVISRGYDKKEYDTALKNSLDYEFPISYPDIGKCGMYLNRIRGNVFYDMTKLVEKNNYSSVGTKLSLDIKMFTLVDTEVTAQYSYLLEEKDYKVDLDFEIKF